VWGADLGGGSERGRSKKTATSLGGKREDDYGFGNPWVRKVQARKREEKSTEKGLEKKGFGGGSGSFFSETKRGEGARKESMGEAERP